VIVVLGEAVIVIGGLLRRVGERDDGEEESGREEGFESRLDASLKTLQTLKTLKTRELSAKEVKWMRMDGYAALPEGVGRSWTELVTVGESMEDVTADVDVIY